MSIQTSFTEPLDRSRDVLRRAARLYDYDHKTIAVSGGTDSVFAADVFCRLAPEFGLEPDSITHINTGASIPQSRLAARIVADMHGLEFVEQGYRNPQDSLAARVLNHGWPGGYGGSPATGGHGLEWANRKDKPMDEIYARTDGMQLWVSGARKLESKKRQGNVPDSGVEQDRPRRVWCAVVGGWTEEEKREYIKRRGLPVSEAYLLLGYSGECVACSFDDKGLLTGVDLLCPELGYAIRYLAVWLYQRVKRAEVDLAPKRLCWGWGPEEELPELAEYDTFGTPDDETEVYEIVAETAQAMVGCDPESCQNGEQPDWILELPPEQLVTRADVEAHWKTGKIPSRFPVGGPA